MENYIDIDSLKNLKKTVAKCISELGKKQDISPQETKAAYDGARLYDWLCEVVEEEEGGGESYGGYSERRSSRRGRSYGQGGQGGSYGSYGQGGQGGSYGMMGHMPMPYPYQNNGGYSGYPGYPYDFMNESYYDGGMGGNSNRGRMSRNGGGSYSRHSIGDRAVDCLEKLMDQAGGEYEKEQLHQYIRMIRAAAEEG